jgi:hypothetical protein
MSKQMKTVSELLGIVKQNGDFRRNYGTVLGACLYLCSLRAARGRAFPLSGLVAVLLALLSWAVKHLWPMLACGERSLAVSDEPFAFVDFQPAYAAHAGLAHLGEPYFF